MSPLRQAHRLTASALSHFARRPTPSICQGRYGARCVVNPLNMQWSATNVRSYSNTTPLWKHGKGWAYGAGPDDEDTVRIQIPGQADIETINCENMTQEEIEKIVEEEYALLVKEKEEKSVPNWKPGMRKRPLQLSYKLDDFKYELAPEEVGIKWTTRDKRCGALAIKVGMMPVFDTWGIRHPCTVLFMDKNLVLGHKTVERDGYMSIRVAAGERKRKNVGVSILGQYKALPGMSNMHDGTEHPPWLIREFRITDTEHYLPIGTRIHARHFVPGQAVDIAGISRGKGFQGPMKRHGFAGLPASHGVSLSHRAHGSVGQCQDPGKVFKGKKMAGKMGNKRVTVQNLRVLKIDRGRNLLYVVGCVPGSKGEWLEVKDAIRRPYWRSEKVLGALDRPPLPTFEYDSLIDGSGLAGHEEFMPLSRFDPTDPDYDEMRMEAHNEMRATERANAATE